MHVDSSVPVTATAVFGRLGQGLFEHTGIGRIAVIPPQIQVLGVAKAFIHSHGFLSCNITWRAATKARREPGAAGQCSGGRQSQLCR